MMRTNAILLINPWITDFAAYNLWAEPLGLFYVASFLKEAGARLSYLDCLSSGKQENPKLNPNGCSRYLRRVVPAPPVLAGIPRRFAVYGIAEEEFAEELLSFGRQDAVLITSCMTYWYPGVFMAIDLVRKILGSRVPVILGGLYAILCRRHAERYSGADLVYARHDLRLLIRFLEQLTGKPFSLRPPSGGFAELPMPMHELSRRPHFFSVLTRRGCPLSCSYCACPLLFPEMVSRSADSVLLEMKTYSALLHTRNVAFYDDALLVLPGAHIIPILERIIDQCAGWDIHLPNGIHAGCVDEAIAGLLYRAGVKTVRIGLETSNEELQMKSGGKTTNRQYAAAVERLRNAGYRRNQVGTYILTGLPGQGPDDVERSIDFVYASGASPHLSSFSPIPGTGIWREAVKSSPFPIEREPLFHNNTVFILGNAAFSRERLAYLKQKAAELRNAP
jgi:radical SAM superfamily enzyme YgiQ (UPF0313 family)